MKIHWLRLTTLVTLVVSIVAVTLVMSSVAFGASYNVTVNQGIFGCCNVTVNGTVVETGQTLNVTVNGGEPFDIIATFNTAFAPSCDYFWGWWDQLTGNLSANVANTSDPTTTMCVSADAGLSAICMAFPTGTPIPTVAPVNYSTVEVSEFQTVGYPYQRQNFVAHDLHWAFYNNYSAGGLCYRTSSDGFNWSAQTLLKSYVTNYVDSWLYTYNGSAFGLWYDETSDYVHIGFVNNSNWSYGDILSYLRARPLSNGSLISSTGWVKVATEAFAQLRAPSVCVNTSGYPFIAATAYWWGDGGFNVQLYHSSTNNGLWTEHIGFPMCDFGNDSATYEKWISVLPVSAGNVSVQYVAQDLMEEGNDYPYQNYIYYNRSTGNWTDAGETKVSSWALPWWNFFEGGPYHSEVAIASAENPDDIYMVWANYYGEMFYLSFDRAGAKDEDMWNHGYEEDITSGFYIAALSIFNDDGDLVVTANDQYRMAEWLDLYTCPFEQTTDTWGNFSIMLNSTQAESYLDGIVAGYKYGSPLGFMWQYSDFEGVGNLDYGWYGDWEPEDWWDDPSNDFPCWILWFILPLVVAVATLIFCLKTISDNLTLQNAAMTMAIVVIVGFITFLIVKALLGNCGG